MVRIRGRLGHDPQCTACQLAIGESEDAHDHFVANSVPVLPLGGDVAPVAPVCANVGQFWANCRQGGSDVYLGGLSLLGPRRPR